ncbi:MAG: T9SS type A sorting domain-containing protein [Lewinellaceae bacterium]|nr:T9SS type A sorting domain-containing protein [Lewinellaceae bacterium]
MKTVITLAALCFYLQSAFLQPAFRGGQISVQLVGDCVTSLTVRGTLVSYFQANSPADIPDNLELCWGDGACTALPKVSQGLLKNQLYRTVYEALHTYPSSGTYVLSYSDCCYANDIISFQNQAGVSILLQQEYRIPDAQVEGCNSNPVFLQPPVDIGQPGRPFIYNPNAYDPDGDSLSYELIPLTDPEVYVFPDEVDACTETFSMDPVTGNLLWESPCLPGWYLFGIKVKEWRNGISLGEQLITLSILIQSPTAVKGKGNALKLAVFPNPALEAAFLEGNIETGLNWQLYDTHGKLVQEATSISFPTRINLEGLPAGLYILHYTDGARVGSQPLIHK